MNERKIYYKKVRDLGQVFSATFGFIRQNFKPLYGSLLFYAGPFLLIAATISAYMFGSSLNMGRIFRGNLNAFYGDLIGSYFISMLVSLIGVTIYNVVLNRNLIENEKLNQGEPLTLKHATINFWPDFGRILLNTFLLVLVMIFVVVIIALVFTGIFSLVGGSAGSGGGVAVALFLILAILAAFLILGPIIAFVPLASLFVCQRDRLFLFPAMGKVFGYMKNNFWNTWIVSFLGGLTFIVLVYIAQIPLFIISFMTTFSRMKSTVGYGMQDDSTPLILVIVTVLSSLLAYGVMVIYHLMIVYQYTNLEEKKEGLSIIDKINQIQ